VFRKVGSAYKGLEGWKVRRVSKSRKIGRISKCSKVGRVLKGRKGLERSIGLLKVDRASKGR